MSNQAARVTKLESVLGTPDGLPGLATILPALVAAEGWLAGIGLSAAEALRQGLRPPVRHPALREIVLEVLAEDAAA